MKTSHYSKALCGGDFHRTCQFLAEQVAAVFKNVGVGHPVLCYSGMSGISSATMVGYFLESDQGLKVSYLYVRKKHEKSHGDEVECSDITAINYNGVPVFVDDFSETGATVQHVMEQVIEMLKIQMRRHGYTFPGFTHYMNKKKFSRTSSYCECYSTPLVPYVFTGESDEQEFNGSFDIRPDKWVKYVNA